MPPLTPPSKLLCIALAKMYQEKKINNVPKKIQETYTPKFCVWFVYFNKMVNLKKAQASRFDTFLYRV